MAYIPKVRFEISSMVLTVTYPDSFQQLPDSFNDWYLQLMGSAPSADLLTHCRRELFHAVWRILLDDEFLEAYKHGIVIQCADGVFRRVYPRIFTYSADYPEK